MNTDRFKHKEILTIILRSFYEVYFVYDDKRKISA